MRTKKHIKIKPEAKHIKKELKTSMINAKKNEVVKTANFSDFAPVHKSYSRAEMDCIWERIVCEVEGKKSNERRGNRR